MPAHPVGNERERPVRGEADEKTVLIGFAHAARVTSARQHEAGGGGRRHVREYSVRTPPQNVTFFAESS